MKPEIQKIIIKKSILFLSEMHMIVCISHQTSFISCRFFVNKANHLDDELLPRCDLIKNYRNLFGRYLKHKFRAQ